MVGDFCLVDVLEAFFKLILRANKVCSIIAMIRQRRSETGFEEGYTGDERIGVRLH